MPFLDKTGLQHLVSKIKNNFKMVPSLVPYGTAVPANANLNSITYLKVGNYYCSLTATAATITNSPADIAFMMEVSSPLSTTIDNESTATWVYRVRKFKTYTGVEYIQEVSSDEIAGHFSYGEWVKVVTSDMLSTVAISGSYNDLTDKPPSGSSVTKFTNKTVAVADWSETTVDGESMYKADITCSGVTEDDMPMVVFSQTDVDSGIFLSTCSSGAGKVTIYASEIPDDSITVPTIAIL